MSKKKGVLFLREEFGEGFGKYTYLDGEKYEGDWRNGKYHGQGTYTWKDGQKYEGEWDNGKRTGRGKMNFPDGREYTGGFLLFPGETFPYIWLSPNPFMKSNTLNFFLGFYY